MELNRIYTENCLDTMQRMPDNFIDLTVTSPPYDNLREYKGYSFEFEKIAPELFRITKQGGVVVWIVGDATINGSETLTSFKQAIYFVDTCGFKLHDTMIYRKGNFSHPEKSRYHAIFEYMFIFSKGRPKTFNPIKDKLNLWKGTGPLGKNTMREANGKMTERKKNVIAEYGMRGNVWDMKTPGQENVCTAIEHPATFSEQMARDHIYSWSNEGDTVYDCFGGSGTTGKMAHLLKRQWILSEISSEYATMAEKRIAPYLAQLSLAV